MGLGLLWSLKHLKMPEYFSYMQILLTIAFGSYQLSLCVIIASSKGTPDKMSKSSFPHLSDTHVSFPLPRASLCLFSQFSIPWHIFLNFPFCQQTCIWNKSLTLSSLLYQAHLACMRALEKYFICVVTFTPAGCNWKLWHYNATVPSNLMLQRNPLRIARRITILIVLNDSKAKCPRGKVWPPIWLGDGNKRIPSKTKGLKYHWQNHSLLGSMGKNKGRWGTLCKATSEGFAIVSAGELYYAACPIMNINRKICQKLTEFSFYW